MTAPAPAPAGAPPSSASNPPGTAAFALAIALAAIGAASAAIAALLPYLVASLRLPVSSIGGILAVPSVLSVAVGLAALVLGIVGVTRPGRPHGRAAAAVAVGAFAVVSTLSGQIAVTVVSAVAVR